MQRFFIEVAYKGTAYAGFQVQQNANTVQGELEKALYIYFKQPFTLTGSSRTDAGVHANQNYFHFDANELNIISEKDTYHLNAILPFDIVIKNINPVHANAHCRFDATSRSYQYSIYRNKNPFLQDTAYYYPYYLNEQAIHNCALILTTFTNFESFSKKNTQVNNFNCNIIESKWLFANNLITYNVKGNRFLRGMVRGLVGTMLQVGRGKLSEQNFRELIESKNSIKTDFSTPAKGLILQSVNIPYLLNAL